MDVHGCNDYVELSPLCISSGCSLPFLARMGWDSEGLVLHTSKVTINKSEMQKHATAGLWVL